MKEIYQEILRILEEGERAAVATVIGATGSTPGKESAKMLIRADGSSVGSIGGGCTEADVWALARRVIETDQPVRKSFTLTPKDAEEEGLACGGIVEIFIEPIGSPMVYLFGAGHIARSVVRIASMVGLNTTVVDDRERFASRDFFPDASRLVVSSFEDAFEKLTFTENSCIVIVTRGHRHDQYVLSRAVRTQAGFIGLIGSKAKITRIFRSLADEGVSPERLREVRAPIGLDIGCRTPEEIAVSIVAQLIAHRRRAYIKGDGASRLASYPEDYIKLPGPRPQAVRSSGNEGGLASEA